MSNSQKIATLELEKKALVKDKDEMVKEVVDMAGKFGKTKEAVQEHVAFILSEFQQTMEVIIKEQESLRNSLSK